jgi:palmitoyltransferase
VELVTVGGSRFEHLPPSPRVPEEAHVSRTIDSLAVEDLGEAHTTTVADEDALADSHPSAGALGPSIGAAALSLAASLPPPSPPLDPLEPIIHAPEDSTTSPVVVPPSSTFPVIPHPPKAHAKVLSNSSATARPSSSSFNRFPSPPADYAPPGPKVLVERMPARVPILTADYRWDAKEGILRPYRSHRCRHCAAVVLSEFQIVRWRGGLLTVY